jgi:hypothetical protein
MQGATASKGEFAKLINVSPGRVSQYISAGKIHGPALDGEGRTARIVIDVARQQLRRSLDVGQMVGNGIATRLGTGAEAAVPLPRAAVDEDDDAFLPDGADDDVAEQIKVEKLKEIRARNRRAEEEDLERRGIYTRTSDVKSGMQRAVARVLNIVEGGMASMASELAGRFGVSQRDVLHVLKLEMRKVRESAAAEAGLTATAMPSFVEEDVD